MTASVKPLSRRMSTPLFRRMSTPVEPPPPEPTVAPVPVTVTVGGTTISPTVSACPASFDDTNSIVKVQYYLNDPTHNWNFSQIEIEGAKLFTGTHYLNRPGEAQYWVVSSSATLIELIVKNENLLSAPTPHNKVVSIILTVSPSANPKSPIRHDPQIVLVPR